MQPMTIGKGRRHKPAANVNPSNPESPWRKDSRILAEEDEPLREPVVATRATMQTWEPKGYLRYEDGAGRKLPERHPSWIENRYRDAVRG